MLKLVHLARAANPAAILFGPVFQREMRTAGRKRGTYWLRFLFAAGLITVVALVFSSLRDTLGGMTGLQRFQTLQSMAPWLAIVVVWFQFVAVALLGPILAAPSVCDEKRAGTLPALMTTPLTSAQIAFGKLTSRLVQLVILSLLSAPLLLAIRVFGGLEAEVVLAAACISISTAFLGAALGLMYSVWHRRATTASMFGLFTLILFQGGPLTLQGILYELADPSTRGQFPEGVFFTCSPAVLALFTQRATVGSTPLATMTLTEIWALNAIYNTALAGAIALLASIALRRVMIREASGGVRASTDTEPAPALADSNGGIATEDPGPRTQDPGPASRCSTQHAARSTHRSTERTVSDRPILWREIRLPTFGSRRVFRVALALTVAILVILYIWAGPYEPGLHATILVIGALAVMVQSLFLTSGGISGEREARTWEVLLCAPLSGSQVILGKYAGALKGQGFVPAMVLAHLAFAAAIGAVHPILVLHAAAIFAGPILLFSAVGVLLSLLLRRSATGAVVNLVLGLLLWAGSWVIAALVAWFLELDSADWYDRVWQTCYAVNPIAMIISAEEPAVFEGGFGDFRYQRVYHIAEHLRLSAGGFTLAVIGVFVGYATAAAAALATAIGAFTRLSGRAS